MPQIILFIKINSKQFGFIKVTNSESEGSTGRGSDGGVKERDGGVDEERVARGETADEAIGDLKEDAAESDGGEFVATVEKDFEAERE